jgi:hypothetical protein
MVEAHPQFGPLSSSRSFNRLNHVLFAFWLPDPGDSGNESGPSGLVVDADSSADASCGWLFVEWQSVQVCWSRCNSSRNMIGHISLGHTFSSWWP